MSGRLRTKQQAPVEAVAAILENYANRAVFRGFSRGPARTGRAVFKMMWHRDRLFELLVDVPRKILRFPVVLPEIPARSDMYAELCDFVRSRQSEALPEHRRVDPAKTAFRCGNKAGNVSLTAGVKDGDFEYAARKIVHLVHEIYMDFLMDGRYYDYLVETFNLDPDKM